jgi:large subunit ribosomal protein L13
MTVYDAEDQILGRLSSVIAKKLLNGEKIFVVNAEKAVIAGRPRYTLEKYLKKVKRGGPFHGPFFPKQPDRIFRRTVRGMLPWDRTRGRDAYRNLKVFIGLPEEFKGKSLEKTELSDVKKLKCRYINLEEISIALGAKKRW